LTSVRLSAYTYSKIIFYSTPLSWFQTLLSMEEADILH